MLPLFNDPPALTAMQSKHRDRGVCMLCTLLPSQGCTAVSIDTYSALARFVGQCLVAYRVPTSLSLPVLLSDCFLNPLLLRITSSYYIDNIVLQNSSRSSITRRQWCHCVSISSSANFYEVDSNSLETRRCTYYVSWPCCFCFCCC
jgi:hypothetical protein